MSLAMKATRGAMWSIVAALLSRTAGLIGSLVLTYFLAPEVIGEVGVAHVVVFTANQLSIIGFGQYLVAKPDLGRDVAFQLNVLNLGFACLALGATWLCSGSFGDLFNAPDMVHYVPGLVLAAMVQRIGFIPARILARDLRFRRLSMGRFASELAYVAVTLGTAALGEGGMSIVYGNLARMLVETVVFVASVSAAEWLKPASISMERLRDIFRFGTPVAVTGALSFASRRWDNLLISAFFGPHVMGLYQMAYNLADVPATQVGEHIGDVLLPSFARMDPERAMAGLVRGTTLLALVVFPLAVGLGAVADSLIPVLLSEEWAGVAPLLMALAVLSVVRPIGWTIGAYLQARDRPMPLMTLSIINVITLLLGIYLLSHFGPVWATAGVGVAFGIHAIGSMVVVKWIDGLAVTTMLRSLAGPLLASAAMAAAVFAMRYAVSEMGGPLGLSLVAEIAAGAVVYVGACFVVAPAATADFIGLVKRALGKGGDGEG